MSSMGYVAKPPFDEDAPPRRSSHAPRVWAGAVLLAAAIALVGQGGCFLIGAVAIANPAYFNPSPSPGPPPVPSWEPVSVFLFTTLNVLAFAFILSAAAVFVVGFLGLCRILFGVGKESV